MKGDNLCSSRIQAQGFLITTSFKQEKDVSFCEMDNFVFLSRRVYGLHSAVWMLGHASDGYESEIL